jgi:hypothetical protein
MRKTQIIFISAHIKQKSARKDLSAKGTKMLQKQILSETEVSVTYVNIAITRRARFRF